MSNITYSIHMSAYTHTHAHTHTLTLTHAHVYSTVVVALASTCHAVILMPRAWMGCAYYLVTTAVLRHPHPRLHNRS